jgi:fructose-bisphosphate aldolase class II
MMVDFSELLKEARRHKYAVGSFNVYNYETIRGVIEAGQELGYPTIVAFAEGYLNNMEMDEVFALVHAMAHKSNREYCEGHPGWIYLGNVRWFQFAV